MRYSENCDRARRRGQSAEVRQRPTVLELPARAKINLTLDVLGTRPDGYHELATIMQSVELWDTVRVSREPRGVTVESNLRYLPTDGRNIAVKAANAFFTATGINGGCGITLFKRIPVAAGLAGGSADAAAVLRALDRLYDAGLGAEALAEIGVAVGADVPFCLTGGTCVARGIGEKLEPIVPGARCWYVICKPPVNVSTARIFKLLDSARVTGHPDTAGAVDALRAGELESLGQRLYNVMEEVTSAECGEIADIKSRLIASGALGAVMSGSGPSVIGLFASHHAARIAARALARDYRETFAVHDCN